MNEHLFAYGTLKRDFNNPMARFLHANAQFIGEGSLQGVLYDLGNYPGFVLSNNGSLVKGEVFQLQQANKVLAALDTYEECSSDFPEPREYRREKAEIHLTVGSLITAWVYVYNYDTSHLKRIASGDFRNKLNKKRSTRADGAS